MFWLLRHFINKIIPFIVVALITSACREPATELPNPTTVIDEVLPSVTTTPTLLLSATPSAVPTLTETAEPTQISVPTPELQAYSPYLPQNADRIIRVPDDFSTIQEGIIHAKDGDIVMVSPGEYFEQINFLGKAIVVTSKAGPKETIIDGGRKNSAVTFWNEEGPKAVLHGFTITNGFARGQGKDSGNFPFGGGISIVNASPTISRCRIVWNAAIFGGGILVEGPSASPMIKDSIISKNIAAERGGGIQIKGGAAPEIINNQIIENLAMDAAGIEVIDGSAGVIEGNLIAGNISGYDFGSSDLEPYLNGEDITANKGQNTFIPGGILVTYHSAPRISANVIKDNVGGGVGVLLESTPNITGNIVHGNRGSLADGIIVYSGSSPVIYGNSIWNTKSAAIWVRNANIGLDRSEQGSEETIKEENSVIGSVVFWQKEAVEEVRGLDGEQITVPGDNNRIQAAIEAADDGDTVIVAPGHYKENLNFLGKQITVRSQNPDDDAVVSGTIIEGTSEETVVFIGGETEEAQLRGFTITNSHKGVGIRIIGGASPTISENVISDCKNTAVSLEFAGSPRIIGNIFKSNEGDLGGGISSFISSPIIKGNKFMNNAAYIGAGINAWFSSLEIHDNTFQGNVANGYGAGIQVEHYSTGTIRSNHFSGNKAEGRGTISMDDFANVTLDSNIIHENWGGGISMIFDCHTRLVNNLISHNKGGGIFVASSYPELVNNTLVDNREENAIVSNGIFVMQHSRVTIINTILLNSRIELYGEHSDVDISYSLIVNYLDTRWPGDGNIYKTPRFVSEDDYHLSPSSPCIDSGIEVDVGVDLEENSRPQGAGYDIGAYEYSD